MSIDLASTERVVGIEMEYSPSFVVFNQDERRIKHLPIPVEQILLVDSICQEYGFVQEGFMGNGFRCAVDCGMTEIDTPECYPDKVGLAQLASEQMVIDALEKQIQRLRVCRSFNTWEQPGYMLPLRASGKHGTSGYHENYQMLKKWTPNMLCFIVGHAATQLAWTGQGQYDASSDVYSVAQKAWYPNFGAEYSLPPVEVKYVPDIEDSHRYELRRNNYPIPIWQLKHRFSFNSGAVRLAELGLVDFEYGPKTYGKDSEAYDEIACDPFARFECYNGKTTTPVDYELMLAEKIIKDGRRLGFPEYEIAAAQEVGRVCDALRTGKFDEAAGEVHWVRKRQLLEAKTPQVFQDEVPDGFQAKAEEICIAGDSRGRGGLVDILRNKRPDASYSDEAVAMSKIHPPCLPFARERGDNIQSKRDNGIDYMTGWMTSSVLTAYAA